MFASACSPLLTKSTTSTIHVHGRPRSYVHQAHHALARSDTPAEPAACSSSGRHATPRNADHAVRFGGVAAAAAVTLLAAGPAAALQVHMEPANALSLPTWAVHTSSVIEWVTAMTLLWRLAEVTGNERWKGLTWGMLPCLGSAMCACTWHLFYNAAELDFLVALQAGLTVVGNFTCWLAAYRIYEAAQAEKA